MWDLEGIFLMPMLVTMITVLVLIFVNSRVGYELVDLGIEVRFSARTYDLSPVTSAHISSGAHPVSYTMDTRDPLPGGKRQENECDLSLPPRAELRHGKI
jgi:hypothetical protein